MRILLAEDNDVNQMMMMELLGKLGHKVEVAANGLEVLAGLEGSTEFDVILMDVQMPEMGGLEATAAIREREKGGARHVPIIALTAHSMKGDRERCLAAGMDGYLSKPVQREELSAAIREFVGEKGAAVVAVDEGALLQRFGGDRKFLRRMVEIFLTDSAKTMTAIEEAIRKRDAERLRVAAHTLKGSAANFVAKEAVAAAYELEVMGREGNLEEAAAGYDRLKREIAGLREMLSAIARKKR